MYNNSRIPMYMNELTHSCDRIRNSRWSPNIQNASANFSQLSSESAAISTSSFYFPELQLATKVPTTNYDSYHSSQSSSSHLYNYQRPKSTIFHGTVPSNQSTFHGSDFRQNCEPKAIVGVVKPLVHQRSYTQLTNNNNCESKISGITMDSYAYNLTRSSYPLPLSTPPPPPSETSSVVYRSRRAPSHNNINTQLPMVPRRYSSISNSKCMSSRRSSRTTSTSSSIGAVNESSSTISSSDNEQQQTDNKVTIDVKRLEMFYGSVGTLVKSARSIAGLYTTTTRQLVNLEDWSYQQYGVPVWIYNTGANMKRARQIKLLLTQHESCFIIWSRLISNRAELRLPKSNYITCWLPESNLLIVFKFERSDACRLFFGHYYEILQHERNLDLANLPSLSAKDIMQQQTSNTKTNNKEIPRRYSRLRAISTKEDKKQQQQQRQAELRRCHSLSKVRTVKKSAISGPINFEHVNHISSGCNTERPLSGTMTLRSLHASMSHLPTNDTLINRFSKQSKKCASTLFEPRTTIV